MRLFADHALAPDFLHLAVGVGDNPVTREQFRRFHAGVGDGDRVGEDVTILLGLGLILDIDRFHVDVDVPVAVHAAFVTESRGARKPARVKSLHDGSHARGSMPAGGRLRLLSPASSWTLNDTFANEEKIEKQLGPAHVLLHPDDARRLGLSEHSRVLLVNETGRLAVDLLLSTNVPPGVALSYKGRWPKREHSLANVNILNPGEKSDMGESTSVHATEIQIIAG